MTFFLTILLFIVYIINLGLVIYFNPFNVASNFTKTFIILSIITGILNIFVFMRLSTSKSSGFFKILSTLFILYGLIYSIYYFIIFTPWPLTIIITILNILLIICVLSIGYKSFSTLFSKTFYTKDAKGNSSKVGLVLTLIKHLIFYIPCLFIDFIDFIKHEYKITTKTVWIILLIELIIVILRVILPYLYKIYNHVDGHLVKKGPIYLNTETNLGNFQNIKPSNLTKLTNIKYNYAISAWIWINPQPQSTNSAYNKSTSLLNYGDVLNINFNKNKLEFWAASNGKKSNNNKHTDNMLPSNNKIKIYELKNVPYQKWNNIIFNYDGGTLDIFINNKLVSSTINITPIMYYNIVTSGATNGINGGIKDIIYYDKVLSKNDIYSIYSIK